MPGFGKRHIGWGIGVLAAAGVLAAVVNAPRVEPRPPEGLRFIATKDGQVKEILVRDGDIVEAGVDLVMLDDESAQKSLLLAQANLEKVMSEARGSGVAVALPGPPTGIGGTIVQSGPFSVPTPATNPGPGKMPKNVKPLPEVSGTSDGATEIVPKPNPGSLTKLKKEAEKEISEAKAEEAYCESEIENAKLELEEAQKALETSRIITERAKYDSEQGKRLLNEGAISRNASIQRDGQLRAQEAILENNRKRSEEVNRKIDGLKANLAKATRNREQAEADLKAAPEKATPKIETVKKVPFTTTAPKGAKPFVRKPASVIQRPFEGSTAPAKVEIDKTVKRETDTQLTEAKAKVTEAEKGVLDRRLSAPKKMKIVKWLIRPSDQVKSGQAIAIVEYLPETAVTKAEQTVVEMPKLPVMDKPTPPGSTVDTKTESKPLQNETQIPDNNR